MQRVWRWLVGVSLGVSLLVADAVSARAASEEQPYVSPRFRGALRGSASAPNEPLSLWYWRPAEKWVEALALGKGRLGAMVFGGIEEEQLQLNEDMLWAGGPHDPSNPDALRALPEVGALIFAGKYQRMLARTIQQAPIRRSAACCCASRR